MPPGSGTDRNGITQTSGFAVRARLGAGGKPRSLPGVPTFGLGHAGGLTGVGRLHGAGGSRGGGRS